MKLPDDRNIVTGLITNEKTEKHFYGSYKGYEIQIDRDGKKNDNMFYILVWSDAGYAYDGWWPDSADATIDDAIKEAIEGAGL